MKTHQLLRLHQIEEKTGLKRSQIYLYMKDGSFPRSIKIGPASVAWLESEIDEWINLKLAERPVVKEGRRLYDLPVLAKTHHGQDKTFPRGSSICCSATS